MKLEVTKDKNLRFQVQIDGANASEVTPRLVLKENGYAIAIDGTFEQKDNLIECSFHVPKLDKFITQKNINAQIEVIYEDQYAVVWNDTIEIHRPLKVTMQESTITDTHEATGIKEKVKFGGSVEVIEEIEDKGTPKKKSKIEKGKDALRKEGASNKKNETRSALEERIIEEELEKAMTFDFDAIIKEYEDHGNDLEYLKKRTYDQIRNSIMYDELSEISKEKLSILKSPRIRDTEIFYTISSDILEEMRDELGMNIII